MLVTVACGPWRPAAWWFVECFDDGLVHLFRYGSVCRCGWWRHGSGSFGEHGWEFPLNLVVGRDLGWSVEDLQGPGGFVFLKGLLDFFDLLSESVFWVSRRWWSGGRLG